MLNLGVKINEFITDIVMNRFNFFGHNIDGSHKTHIDASNYASFSAAVDACGSDGSQFCTLALTTPLIVTDNKTVPRHVNLAPKNKGKLIISAGKTVTHKGAIVGNPNHKWIDGLGSFKFHSTAIRPIVSPVWTGGLLDGTTNDAVAMQAIMDVIDASGGKIEISGLMGLGSTGWVGISLTSKSNISIIATHKGAGFKLLVAPSQAMTQGATAKVMILFDTCTGIVFKGLDLDLNGLVSAGVGLDTCTDCVVTFNKPHDTANSSGFEAGIITEAGTNNTITYNNGDSCFHTIKAGVSNTGKEETGLILSNNKSTNSHGTGIGATYKNAIITENESSGSGGSGIILAANTDSQSAKTERTIVSKNICYSNTFHGIQFDPINESTIDNTIITENICYLNDLNGIEVWQGINSIISNNMCFNNNSGGGPTSAGIRLLNEDAAGIIKRNNVTGNICFDDRSGGSRTQVNGIYINIVAAGSVEEVNISNNIVQNHTAKGILANGDARLSLKDNQAYDNDGNGIDVEGSWSSGSVSNNLCQGNDAGGTNTEIFIDSSTADSLLISNNHYKGGNLFIGQQQEINGNSSNIISTFTDGDTTPDVAKTIDGSGHSFVTANTGGTSITEFQLGASLGGHLGQKITILTGDGNTTFVHNAVKIANATGGNVTPAADILVEYVWNGTIWIGGQGT